MSTRISSTTASFMSISTTPRQRAVRGSITALTMETTSSALYSCALRRFLPMGRGSSSISPRFCTAERYHRSSPRGSRVIGWISLLRYPSRSFTRMIPAISGWTLESVRRSRRAPCSWSGARPRGPGSEA